jgi:hypothetical protein
MTDAHKHIDLSTVLNSRSQNSEVKNQSLLATECPSREIGGGRIRKDFDRGLS